MGTCNYICAECQKLKKEVNVQSLLNNSPHLLRQDISTQNNTLHLYTFKSESGVF